MNQRDERQRKRKRLFDGRQKEKQRKAKSKPTHHMNAIIQDYFNSILIMNHAKRQRRILKIEHNEYISMTLDTET